MLEMVLAEPQQLAYLVGFHSVSAVAAWLSDSLGLVGAVVVAEAGPRMTAVVSVAEEIAAAVEDVVAAELSAVVVLADVVAAVEPELEAVVDFARMIAEVLSMSVPMHLEAAQVVEDELCVDHLIAEVVDEVLHRQTSLAEVDLFSAAADGAAAAVADFYFLPAEDSDSVARHLHHLDSSSLSFIKLEKMSKNHKIMKLRRHF